jgi:HEAT repeat protein
MSDQSRLALEPGVDLDQVTAAAEQAGWEQFLDDPRDGNRPRRVAWHGPWPGIDVYYIDDHLIKVPYLLIHGPDSEQAVEDVEQVIPSYGMERALFEALFARESEDKKAAIRRIAVLGGASPPDRAALQLFEAAFVDPDPDVRKTAVGASTYPAWREFEPRLEIVANGDQEESVRDLAARTLSALRRHDWA